MRSYGRRVRESGENRERWLVSYADFITLLFAFFTTLYAISVVDAAKADRLVKSIQESFGDTVFELGTDDPVIFDSAQLRPRTEEATAAANRAVDDDRIQALETRARELVARLEAKDGVRVEQTERGLVISLTDSLFFESAGEELADPARKLVAQLAELLSPLPNHLQVEGHTDNRPIASRRFASNWHLSAARAVSVVRTLEDAGIPRYRLSAAGFADQRPLVSNGSPEGRRLNRRVDVVVLRTQLDAGGD